MTRKHNGRLLLVSLLLSFLFLGLCSKNSPLYPMNIWPDVNCFFTVGKSMLHGMIPYRDLYEQKGPILYFIYALAAMISENSFLGAYILDALSFGLFLFFSGLCAKLYLGSSPAVYPIVAVLAAILSSVEAAAHGGSAEQMFLSLLMFSFWLINRSLCENRILKLWEAFAIGICAGICLYVKFTFLGFFFGLALFVLVWYVLFEKQAKALPAVIGAFLGGIAAVSVPVFLYFLLNGAIGDFFTVYFYNNLFLYQKQEMSKIYFYLFYLYTSLRRNIEAGAFLVLGGVWMVLTLKKNYKLLTAFLLSELFLSVAVLAGGVFFIYYPMILMAPMVYGLIAAAQLLGWIFRKIPALASLNLKARLAANLVLAAVLLGYSFVASSNTDFLGTGKAELPQYRFAAQMAQTESATLLNYGFLDGGFYFAADILPSTEFFCQLNIIMEEMNLAQNRQVENGMTDYVITQNLKLEDCGLSACPYTLLDSAPMELEGDTYTYYLYQRVN